MERIPGFAYPLSSAQERFWLIDRIEQGIALNNSVYACLINGGIALPLLTQAVAGIICRHESLRTKFVECEGKPAQMIVPAPAAVTVPVLDLRRLLPESSKSEILKIARVEVARRFCIEQPPLLRMTALQTGDQEYVLLLTAHHIVADGWSFGVFMRELSEFYGAALEGRQPSPNALPLQVIDFAVREQEWLNQGRVEQDLLYWRAELKDVVDYSPSRSPTAMPSGYARRRSITLPPALVSTLSTFCRQQRVTLFVLLMAGLQAILWRLNGQKQVAVGTVMANRDLTVLEPLIGCFVNTVIICGSVSGDQTFDDHIQAVKKKVLQSFSHRQAPFHKVVECLCPNRKSQRTPLFNVLFIQQNASFDRLELPGIKISPIDLDDGIARIDLRVAAIETLRGLKLDFKYDVNVFPTETIERMLSQFQRLLETGIQEPLQCLSQLLMSPAEEQQVALGLASGPLSRRDEGADLMALFERQVRESPERPAVVCEDAILTYYELDRRANRLARYLQSQGAGPDVPVGICLYREVELILSVIAVLKSGSAYLPLDVDIPPSRLELIVKDSAMRLILAAGDLAPRLSTLRLQVIVPKNDWPEIEGQSDLAPDNNTHGENAAYVIYTSGSTGVPKGVAVERRQLTNYILAVGEHISFPPGASFAMIQPHFVDACITILPAALCWGGSIYIPGDDVISDGPRLSAYIDKHQIDCLKMAPTHLSALESSCDTTILAPRRWVILGGEPSPATLVRRLQARLPGGAIFNHYGPTETTVAVLIFKLGPGAEPLSLPALPLGRPLSNCQVYILNEAGQPVAPGESGELFVGGQCVARGYLNQPQLTAERFVPHPFIHEVGERLYRTGDAGRFLPDGNIEFLGRLDDQVKIRGFRVETAEIEASLLEHSQVQSCAVIAVEHEDGVKMLAAYVVTHAPVGKGELRRHLIARLPGYMIPAVFVYLDDIPRTLHGKLDRRRLPQLRQEESGLVERRLTAVEKDMIDIWSTVLKIDRIDLQDDFFEIGGHSLSATQIIARARKAFGVELTVRTLFDNPTLAAFARIVELAQQSKS